MKRKRKKYEDLVITDDFMFGKVMRHPQRCGKLLEMILGVKIREVVFLEDQESLNPDYAAKGIRMDVYLEDAGNAVYNVEMQTENTGELPERSRYYQAVIDINLIKRGEDYDAVKKSYVIFICTFDLFGAGRQIYHFENLCREDPAIRLDDGTEKIFLNTKGRREAASEPEEVGEDLWNLLGYLEGAAPCDAYTEELDKAVRAAREHREWRREYMKLEVMRWDMRREGRAEGRTEVLISQLYRKIKKGKTLEEIAEDLEEEADKIKPIYDMVVKYLPNYEPEKILKKLNSKDMLFVNKD